MINAVLMDRIRADLNEWEREFLWMYLDSEGYVTIGYGTKLSDVSSALNLPFHHDQSGTPATAAEVSAAWNVIISGAGAQKAAATKDKYAAMHYSSLSDLRIDDRTASTLRDQHVQADSVELKSIYRNFDIFPDDAKLALFDMIYNIGAGRNHTRKHRASGLRAYVTMNAAINAPRPDWKIAAENSSRRGIPSSRNHMTYRLFMGCAWKARSVKDELHAKP